MASISRLMDLSSKKGTDYDHVIVECSGIAEPRRIRDFFQQAEDFDLDFAKKAKLDTLITVVDALSFFTLFGSDSQIKDFKELAYRPEDQVVIENDGNSQRKVTELLLEQVECADVILINKCDLLNDPKDVQLVERVVASINPSAKIMSCTRGKVPDPLALVASANGKGAAQLAFLDEHRNLLKAADEDNKLDDEHHHDHGHAPSCDLDGSNPSLVSARRALMRSKGFIWMSTSKSAAYFMSHAGQYLELNVLGRWWADIPKEEWPQGLDQDIRTDFDGPDGDRRQELVFIGQFGKEGGKSKQALEEALDACLLTNEEMAKYKELAPKGDNALVDHFAP
eukprot:gene11713-8347_t